MERTTQLYSLAYTQGRTYLLAAIFVLGNILLPQLTHFVPQGGFIFLPIYFFTLIAAYKYGWKAGLLVGVLSPVINHLLFGMPALAVMPAILVKSVLLVAAAAYIAHRTSKVSLVGLVAVVLFYQVVGTLVEWAMVGDFAAAVVDFRLGLVGMAIQIVGGYFLLKRL